MKRKTRRGLFASILSILLLVIPVSLLASDCPGLCRTCSDLEIICDSFCFPDEGELMCCYDTVIGCASGGNYCECTRYGSPPRDIDGTEYEME